MASGPVGVIAAVTGLVRGSTPRLALIAGGMMSLAWLVFVLTAFVIHAIR
jgi:hypothetical protein